MKKNILLLFFIPFAIFAQDRNEDKNHQKIVMSVLQLINDYESASSFANENRITQFLDLFDNLNTIVVNDIPAIGNYDQQISIEEYTKLMRLYYSRIGVDIDIHEISSINYTDENQGSLSVFLTKKVYGENAKHSIQVTEKYRGKVETFTEYVNYEDEFELEFIFKFNNESIKISNINLYKPKGKLLVISPHSKRIGKSKLIPIDEIKVSIDGEEKQLSGYFYSISNITDKTNIIISSKDETLIGEKKINLKTLKDTDEKNIYLLPFTKTVGDLQVFTLLNSNLLTVNPNSYNALESDITSTSFGGSLSINLDDLLFNSSEKKKKKKVSVYAKGGIVSENFDYNLNIPSFTESYNDIDSDGDEYVRTVLIENFKENQVIDLQTFFVGAELRLNAFKVNKFDGIASISAGLGNVTTKSATYSNTAQANYSGYYEDLFGITIADNGVYDFGNYALAQSGNLDFNTSVQTLILDLNAMIKYKDRLMFSVGAIYTQYQTNIFDIATDRVSNDFNELNTLNNLIDVDMSHISIKVGVSYKF